MSPLHGRTEDLAWLRALCAAAESGRSSTTVLEGDAGIGKTALVTEVLAELAGFEVVHLTGAEVEFDLPFAALQRLVLAHRDALDRLADTHRTTLLVASGLADGANGNRAAIGLALLSLVTLLAAERPVFCWIDDAQWIDEDSLNAFAFVGRRLLADPIVLVFGCRTDAVGPQLTGLPVRRLTGLPAAAAVSLLRAVVAADIEPAVAERIADATGGNPLALRDLGDELTRRQLEGAALLPEPIPLGAHLQSQYLRQVDALPPAGRHWLLIAALDAEGALSVIAAAAGQAGLPADASTSAELADLVAISDRVLFRHQLIRSAVHAGSTLEQRRDAHRYLARAAADLHLEQRALLHRAAASSGVDDELADQLELAAAESGRRGDYATRTRLLVRAADACLGARRASRLLAAAQSALLAGAMLQSRALTGEIDTRFLRADQNAELDVVRAESLIPTIDAGAFGGRADALLRLARALESARRPDQALDALGMGIRATWLSTYLTTTATAPELAHAAERLTRDRPPGAATLALRCYAEFVLGRPGMRATYQAAVREFLRQHSPDLGYLTTYSGVVHTAGALLDDAGRDAVLAGLEASARGAVSDYLLVNIVSFRAHFDIQVGRVATGRARIAETIVLLTVSGYPEDHLSVRALRAGLRGWTGEPAIDPKEAATEAEACRLADFGAGVELWVRAELLQHLAANNRDAAWDAAHRLLATGTDPDAWLAVDLIEAAVHHAELRTATALRDRLERDSRVLNTPVGAGLRAMSAALLAADPEPPLREAITALAAADNPMYAGRAHLLLGEWLRRARRRSEATAHLEQAASRFRAEGAESWLARAARELAPLGIVSDLPQRRPTALTAQEEAIANLAGDGVTNQVIAERLFLSPSTVDYHLRKVFRKLDVTSRRQLAAALNR
ncbi:AAA family ATPase [Nocardia sp. NPDC048505]|uniref:helix-turn-helix transcriptional regulator n=1 Tax=unclassified Nocardia TaxID=2637762 RepID=UPI003401D6E1